MTIRMSWGSDWVGQASATLPTLEDCCESLRGSVRRSLRWITPQWRGCLMKRCGRELRARMGTEARQALDQGKSWTGRSGPVWVALWPETPKPPAWKTGGLTHGVDQVKGRSQNSMPPQTK